LLKTDDIEKRRFYVVTALLMQNLPLLFIPLQEEKGVEEYFEKENIYTLDSKGELLITIMSSLAQ